MGKLDLIKEFSRKAFNTSRNFASDKLFSASAGACLISVLTAAIPACFKLLGMEDEVIIPGRPLQSSGDDATYAYILAGLMGAMASGVGMIAATKLGRDDGEGPESNFSNGITALFGAAAMTYGLLQATYAVYDM